MGDSKVPEPLVPASTRFSSVDSPQPWTGSFYQNDTASGAAPETRPLLDPMRQLLRHLWRFLPGALFGWLLVERAATQVAPDNRGLAVGFLFLVALVFPGAVAASNSAVTGLPWWHVFWRRLSVVADDAMAGLALGLAVVAVAAVAWVAGAGEALQQPSTFATTAAMVVLLGLTRIWPFAVVPYMQAPEADIPDPRSPGAWRHGSVCTTWKLTRTPGTFRHFTLPWMLALMASIAATVAATHLGGTVARSLLLYPVVLPGMTALTWALVERMTSAAHRHQPQQGFFF